MIEGGEAQFRWKFVHRASSRVGAGLVCRARCLQSGPTGIKVLMETYMDVALPEKLISKNRQEGEIW